MFPNDVDKGRYPLASRRGGIVVGTMIMTIAVPLCLVSPGTLEITLPIVLATCLFFAWQRGNLLRVLTPTSTNLTKIAAALLGFAAVSALWSDRPFQTIGWVSGTAFAALFCGMGVRYVLLEPRSSALHIAEGLWIGFLAGLLYLGIEAVTDQAIKIFIYNLIGFKEGSLKPPGNFNWRDGRIVSIADFDLTRSFTSIPLLLWGCLLAILGSQKHWIAKPLAWVTLALAFFVTFVGSNETAKVAMLAGMMSFVIAYFSVTWGTRLLQVGWLIACLAIVPISLALHRAKLHEASWVQPTAQHRILIWTHFTEGALEQPLFGVGAGMAYWHFDPNKKPQKGEPYSRYARDAHSVYLQTWFELGVVGAILLSFFGLALLDRMRRLPAGIVPYAHATFASTAAVLAASYGLWRPWFNLTFAISAVAFAIGLRAMIGRQQALPGPGPGLRWGRERERPALPPAQRRSNGALVS